MKRSQAFPSNYLGKEDVPEPVTGIIDTVHLEPIKCEHGEEDKPVLRFAHQQFKPLILNNVNWLTLEDAYGDDSDDWQGKPVEIYVDPSVMFAGRRVGGIRVRVPDRRTAPTRPANGTPQKPAAPRTQTQQEPDLAAEKARALRELAHAGESGTREDADATKRWYDRLQFSPEDFDDLDHAYEDAIALMAQRPPARRAARQSA